MQKDILPAEPEQARYQTVSTTFEVSAESLQRLKSTDASAGSALVLLDIPGFMHHRDVSEEIFVRAWKYEEVVLVEYGNENVEEDGDIEHLSAWHVARRRAGFSSSPPHERLRLFRKARAHLERLSLVSLDRAAKSISLHSMVHAWARERVVHAYDARTAAASTLALSSEGDQSWRPFSSELARHYESSSASLHDISGIQIEQWELCRMLYANAWQMYRASSVLTVSICKDLLKRTQDLPYRLSENPPVIGVEYLLAMAQHESGQIDEAVQMLEHVVKVHEELAEDHPSRLASQHALAGAYQANGQRALAIGLLNRVVAIKQKRLRVGHPSRTVSEQFLADMQEEGTQSPTDASVEALSLTPVSGGKLQ
nr:hypothetical protein B0A51_06934 [Rachicladosporium sp. CCFEE 5018]